ncbi:MAG: AEC family transporter [Lachnospiraceae bacterium]|nr:AEC family transporter [Lachnospiraceae bacterium]
MEKLITLQLTMFILMLTGLFLRKKELITAEGKRVLTDLVINVILPANIIKSFLIEFNKTIFLNFLSILLISIGLQILCIFLSHVLYKKETAPRRKVLQYGIVCSNAGFLGNPLAEGVFGSMGLSLASIYLIPMRVVMWSVGVSFFTESPDKKTLIKKVLTHPCIIAVLLGISLMLSQFKLPGFLLTPLTSLSSCNTAMSMLVVGTILAEIDFHNLIDKTLLSYTVLRLLLLPLIIFTVCSLLPIDSMVKGVSTLLTAMPTGATTAILASKYEGDAPFATKCVVFTTALSLVTTFIWSMILL